MRIARSCNRRRFMKSLLSGAFALSVWLCVPSTPVYASNLDQRIEFWVHEAPLSVVIEQIANLTGRSVDISGVIEGTVSGTFDNSLLETLTSFSGDYELLFDLDADTLYAITNQAKSVASVEVFSAQRTQELQDEWRTESLPGSRFVINDGRVKLSGHPAFVHRITQALSGDRVKAIAPMLLPPDIKMTSKRLVIPEATKDQPEPPTQANLSQSETVFPEVSTSAENSQILEAAASSAEVDTASEKVTDAVSTAQETVIEEFVADVQPTKKPSDKDDEADGINSVTEIPGFSTF